MNLLELISKESEKKEAASPATLPKNATAE